MTKAYCPNCRINTNHNIVHERKIASKKEDEFGWLEEFEIIECAGCENIQFRHSYGDETMADYDSNGDEISYYKNITCYPLSIQNHTTLKYLFALPPKIKIIYTETLEAFKVKSYILTGIGFRSVIEAICIDKNISGRNLQQKINNLLKKNLITAKECSRLHPIRFLGNDSVHEMFSPETKQLMLVLDIVDNLLYNLYLIDLNIEDHLETLITEYSKFVELVWYLSNKLNGDSEITIKVLLGKHIRRFEEGDLVRFIQKLIKSIEESKISWLSFDTKEPKKGNILDSQKFRVTK